MHAVLAGVVGLDRQKSAGANMQGQGGEADTAACQRRDQGGCEMQTGGGGGDRALVAGEHRLIIGMVALVAA